MDIARENLTEKFVKELTPLVVDHANELEIHGGAVASVNWEIYHQLNVAGLLWVFSARGPDGSMEGYASYVIEPSPHCEDIYTAYQDAFYVIPQARGHFVGPQLLQYAEKKLKPLVHAIRQSIPIQNDFSPMLVRKGYELTELVYEKRL